MAAVEKGGHKPVRDGACEVNWLREEKQSTWSTPDWTFADPEWPQRAADVFVNGRTGDDDVMNETHGRAAPRTLYNFSMHVQTLTFARAPSFTYI